MKHINKIEKILSTSVRKELLQMFLDPARASNSGAKHLWANTHAKPACPVYQRGVVDSATVDVGNHQTRAILVTPHIAAPVMISHSRLASRRYVWSDLARAEGGRLYDDTMPGYYAGNGAFLPPFDAFCIPEFGDFALVGQRLVIPIHGSYGTAIDGVSGGQVSVAQSCYEDFTSVLTAGSDTGIRAIPVELGDTCSGMILGTTTSAAFANGDLVVDLVTSNAFGVLTTTTANVVILGAPLAGSLPFLASWTVNPPAGAVGVVSVSLRSTVVGRSISFARVTAWHINTLGTGPDVSTGLGAFTGSAVSGLPSLRAIAQEARVSALSVLLTNTTSSLNANGFITSVGTPSGLPASYGIYGEDSVASISGAKTFAFTEGSYVAIRPAEDLRFSSLDSSPGTRHNRAIIYVRGQDATPVSFKLEYQSVVEVVSSDPLFPPMNPISDPVFERDMELSSESAACIMISENARHLAKILGIVSKVAKTLAPSLSLMNPELGALAGGIGMMADAGRNLSPPSKKKKQQTKKSSS